ncbi:two-component regulator propeller domain-containing protein [Formosa sp. PL04]|uniref:hybrid sensor histidine kinase/response regulator transcription factor n=1 Tax=Formosa sp. PL04 TaxID=3081755 RepID=UPI002981274D|nr:two-component regulator propeller domain-containing protein [Formosa sp. PL04]MDW5289197.1 two-component regulator propeller domain-containing protein [Formosa sp. PL04]
MNVKKVFLFLFVCTWSMFCIAQKKTDYYNNIKFKQFSTHNGVSQRSVISILQDNQGFMWFGTRYGLNKYDGNTFKNYNYNSEDSLSLSHNWIKALAKDTSGDIWVGTKNGLNKYNSVTDNFTRIKKNNLNKSYYTNEIWDLKKQDSIYLWIATNMGLDRFNTKTGNILNFSHNKNNPHSISSNQIRKILITQKGDLWVCTSEKIDVYDAKGNSFKHYDYPENVTPNITKNSSLALFEDTNQNIWLGYENGLAKLNLETNTFEDYKLKSASKNIITTAVRSICEDRDGQLWIGAYDGLYRIDIENGITSKYEHDNIDSNSLSQNSIYKILEDSRGDLWIGTWAGGINYFDRSSNNFSSFSVGSNNKNLNYKVVSSIVEDENENLWIGTEGGGVNFYNKSSGMFTYYTHDPNNSNSLSANNVKAILKDHFGNFWIGTHDGGLNLLTIKGDKMIFKVFKNNFKGNISFSVNKITALAEDDDYNIWIGTNEEGLNLYNRSSNTFVRIKDLESFIGNFVYTISKSKFDNRLFVGSENGLSKINVATKQISKINFRDKGTEALNSNLVTVVYEESATSLWIGTEGDGIFNYNTETKKSVRYGLGKGLPNEVVYGVLPDNQNNIWLSTNKGLSRLNLETKRIKNFDKTDELQGNEFNYGAFIKTKKDNLIFGGINGFTIFNPNQIKTDKFLPPIAITAFKVRNKPYTTVSDSTKTISLRYNQNDFSFNFVALNYSQPNKTQYAYKLEGFDNDWNFIGNHKTAVYTNLNPGNYTFKVKASNSDGVWNENDSELSIKIAPPLWGTWWAYVIYLILLLSVFLFIRHNEVIRIRNRNALRQERLDKEQMEEVNRLKLQLFTNISHDFRTPLTLIIGPLKKMLNEKTGSSSIHNQLSGMYRNASILLQLINQLLDFRKSEAGKLHLHASKNDLVDFLKNIQLSFEELAKDRNIKYELGSSDAIIEVWFDKIEMKKVILNILSNAFKFTPKNGEISLKISNNTLTNKDTSSTYVKIEIKDSGKGIPKDDLEFVFNRYFQLGQQHELRSGTGVGLALAKDIVELHKGKIYVESNLGEGSCFTVLLPLGNTHLEEKEIIYEDVIENDLLDYYEGSNVASGWIREETDIDEIEFNDAWPSILLVEDNIEVRQFIKEIFRNDFNVFEAKNGLEGIHLAQYNPIDVIVSDVMMPEMDGMEMCHQIKSDIRTSHIPVILLTARTSSKVQKEGYETGADVYLTKPFDGETLKLQVLNILKSRKSLIYKFKKDILLEPKEITVVSADEVFLKRAMDIIEENLSNSEFNVNVFNDKLGMSQTVVYKKIKVLTGQTVSEFIRTIRLKRASHLLLQTDLNIADIVYDIGFNDLKYFRRCFKRVFNDSPSAYRKKMRKNI